MQIGENKEVNKKAGVEGPMTEEKIGKLRQRLEAALNANPKAKAIIDSGEEGWFEKGQTSYVVGADFMQHPKLEELKPIYDVERWVERPQRTEGEGSTQPGKPVLREKRRFIGWFSTILTVSDTSVDTKSTFKRMIGAGITSKRKFMALLPPINKTQLDSAQTGQKAGVVADHIIQGLVPV